MNSSLLTKLNILFIGLNIILFIGFILKYTSVLPFFQRKYNIDTTERKKLNSIKCIDATQL